MEERSGAVSQEIVWGEGATHSDEFDPYASVRSAMAPECANLPTSELSAVLAGRPASIVLHQLLNSPEIRQATLALLLGKSARHSIRLEGVDIPIPAYLRTVSRLCREVAEQGEAETRYGASPPRTGELRVESESPLSALGEVFDPASPPENIANALALKDWTLALRLAIEAGMHNANDLTNFLFFAKHPELPRTPLDPHAPNYRQLSEEWGQLLEGDVWKAIQASSENASLAVSGAEVTDQDRFFWGSNGKRLKQLVADAAKKVDINPGLLGGIMMAETRRPQSYLSGEKVSSYHIGTDDFYEARAAIAARVPAYAQVKWDKNQTPIVHDNDAITPRKVETILFDSGPDAVLATAVYIKFREVRLREIAAEWKQSFDGLPMETRFALTRMAMAAGTAGVTPLLKDALGGKDILIRKPIPVKIFQTQRNATVRTAQALHLSDWIFGIKPVPGSQEEAQESAGNNAKEVAGEQERGVIWENLAPADLPADRFTSEIGKFQKGSGAQVTKTQEAPFKWICNLAVSLRITSPAGTESRTGALPLGTGTLISPCHVLTAAHVLLSREPNNGEFQHQRAERVWVIPARDEDGEPFGRVEAKSWKLHPKWDPDKASSNYDYALITLEKPLPHLCYWGDPQWGSGTFLDSLPDAMLPSLIGAEISTAGYPESKNRQMWCFKGNLSSGSIEQDAALKQDGGAATAWAKRAARFGITADTERSQSGSPVWLTKGDKRYLIGVLTDAGSKLNWVVAVNDSVVRELRSWMGSECAGARKPAEEYELPVMGDVEEPRPVAFEGEDPLPKGVPKFDHFFQPMKANPGGDAWVADGAEKELAPLNPGFIDDKDSIEPSPLQDNLTTLLTENEEFSRFLTGDSVRLRKAGPNDKIRVALIDLTGSKITQPQFAGWGSTVAVDSGSAVKVAVLYASFQLKADLEHTARVEGIAKTTDLCKIMDERWQKAGIHDRPKLMEIFNGNQNPPGLGFAHDFEDAIDHVIFHEANVASSVLIKKMGFPYIASVLWNSGLRHPKRGGLWLFWNFDSDHPQQWDSPARPSPGPVFPHTATALSLSTFFALLAQGRLINPASSGEMKRRLRETWYSDVLPGADISAKVGLLHNLANCLRWEIKDGKRKCAEFEINAAHEADLIQNGKLRYAVAIMTKDIPEGIEVLRKLIVRLDDLVRRNNP